MAVPAEVDEHDVALADPGAVVGRDAHEVVDVEQVAGFQSRSETSTTTPRPHSAVDGERVHRRLGALGHHVRGRVDVRADVLGQDQRLQAVAVALDESGVVDDVELGVREEARHVRAQRRREVDGLEAVQGGDERIHRSDRRIQRRGHVSPADAAAGADQRTRERARETDDPCHARQATAESAGRRGMMATMEATATTPLRAARSSPPGSIATSTSPPRGSSIPTEIRGGAATFLTMAYILFVNPQILGLGRRARAA